MTEPNLNEQVQGLDFSKLSIGDVDRIGAELGDKLRAIVDKACEEANSVASIYGLKVRMQFVLKPESDSEEILISK